MGDNKKGSLAEAINWGGKNDKKPKKKEKSLLEKMKFYRNGGAKKVESVTVSAPNKEGMEKGLDFAKKLIDKGEDFKCGGKKMANGGMKKSDALREMASKDKYSMPDDVKGAMKKALGSQYTEAEEKAMKDKYELPEDISSKMDKLKSSFLKRKKRK